MNDCKRFTMEAVEEYSNIILEIARKDRIPTKTSVRIADGLAEIRTKHLPNTSLQHCL
jgi:hypothetical protein